MFLLFSALHNETALMRSLQVVTFTVQFHSRQWEKRLSFLLISVINFSEILNSMQACADEHASGWEFSNYASLPFTKCWLLNRLSRDCALTTITFDCKLSLLHRQATSVIVFAVVNHRLNYFYTHYAFALTFRYGLGCTFLSLISLSSCSKLKIRCTRRRFWVIHD